MKTKDEVLNEIFDNDPLNILDISNNREITQSDHDAILQRIVEGMSTASLLAIPGVYELVSEELHNDVLCEWERSL